MARPAEARRESPHRTHSSTEEPHPDAGEDAPKPKKWWQWFLVYPTLVITALSAIPTYVDVVGSTVLGVPVGHFRQAVRENALWKENIACAAAPFNGVLNENNIAVDAVVCQSGNVLVRVKPPSQRTPAYKWVPLDSVTTSSSFLIRSAVAAEAGAPFQIAQGNFMVLCQQWIGNGLLRRRVHDRGANRCFDETVNTFNGQVVSWNPAPCAC
jgi:hypothetical protein